MNVLQFLTNHLETIAFDTSVVAIALGVLALVLVCFGWSWLGPRYRDFWAKFAVALFRALAAASPIAAKVAPIQAGQPLWAQPWALTVLIAIGGYLLWDIVGALGDHKSKLSKERTIADHKREIAELQAAREKVLAMAAQDVVEANQDREDAEFEALRLNWLLTHLRRSVSEKLQRVRLEAQSNTSVRASIPQTRAGLDPEKQAHMLLELLASLFHYRAVHDNNRRYNQNFRIGLFADRDGWLELLDAFDLITRSHKPFSSYEQHSDRYRLNNDSNPSHAVRCVREGRTLIVTDCETESYFEFFHDRQRQYLKSMVAHPLVGFCPDGINPTSAALLIDTDQPGFFREEDREMVESLLNEFVLRISLEYATSALMGSSAPRKGGGDERSLDGPGQDESRRPHQTSAGIGLSGDTRGRSQAQEPAGDEATEAAPPHGEGQGKMTP